MPQVKDLTGKRFGMLVVEGFDHREPQRRKYFWRCVCDCGRETVASGCNLTSGNTRSCGCLGDKNRQKLMKAFTDRYAKHGLSASRINRIYRHMKERCYEKAGKDYELYGGRGITVCDDWLGEHGFENFYAWSMVHGYAESLSIDRVDTDKGYSPDNCRWVNATVQANNRRTNVVYDIGNGPQTRAELCKEYGIPYFKFRDRVASGWTVKEALEIDKRQRAKR